MAMKSCLSIISAAGDEKNVCAREKCAQLAPKVPRMQAQGTYAQVDPHAPKSRSRVDLPISHSDRFLPKRKDDMISKDLSFFC